MKISGVIPARYASTRLPGKPLMDIGGKPMIWWVYNKLALAQHLDEIIIATDDERIVSVCNDYKMNCMLTSELNRNPTERMFEVAGRTDSDIYIFVGGDEPMVKPSAIEAVIDAALVDQNLFVLHAMTTIKTAPEVIDFTNVKVVVNDKGEGLYASRSPIPYPKGSLDFKYKKAVGISAYSREALMFFGTTPQSQLEIIEECDLIRFIEHKKNLQFIDIGCDMISVDTAKDLEMVRKILVGK